VPQRTEAPRASHHRLYFPSAPISGRSPTAARIGAGGGGQIRKKRGRGRRGRARAEGVYSAGIGGLSARKERVGFGELDAAYWRAALMGSMLQTGVLEVAPADWMAAPAGSIEDGMGRHASTPLLTPAGNEANVADDQRLAGGVEVRYEQRCTTPYLILWGIPGDGRVVDGDRGRQGVCVHVKAWQCASRCSPPIFCKARFR
jgi:hypothetical protein